MLSRTTVAALGMMVLQLQLVDVVVLSRLSKVVVVISGFSSSASAMSMAAGIKFNG